MADYDFRGLSPHDFELLVRDLLQARDAAPYESFAPGPDDGIDLRYLSPDGSKLIVQCKHYADSSFATLRSNLRKKELPKIAALKAQRYILATSLPMTPDRKDTIVKDLTPHVKTPADILGAEDLNALLDQFPGVEKVHYKLWLTSTAVLQSILHNGIAVFTNGEIEDMQRRCSLYVPNAGYDHALEVLDKHHSCIIAGQPGIGKTMLAEALLLRYMDEGYEPVVVSANIAEADDVYTAEGKQVFYYDDFLGQTALVEKLGKKEDARLIAFINRLESNPEKRLIMTTRGYILKQAQQVYEPLARADAVLPRYVLKLVDYTRVNRAQILYNHIWFSSLSDACRVALVEGREYVWMIEHKNYSPRLIAAIVSQAARTSLTPEDFIAFARSALDNPAEIWAIAYRDQLDDVARAILLSLTLQEPFGANLDKALEDAIAYADLRGLVIRREECERSLRTMEDSFIRIETTPEGEVVLRYQNPSIRDFMLAVVDEDPSIADSLMRSVSGLDSLLALGRYALAVGDDSTSDEPKYPTLRGVMGDLVNQYSDLIFDSLLALIGPDPGPGNQPTLIRELDLVRMLRLLTQLAPGFVPSWIDGLMDRAQEAWAREVGSRTSAASLVQVIADGGLAPPDRLERLDQVLRNWTFGAFDELEQFSMVLEMERTRSSSIDETEVEQARSELDAWLDAELDYLKSTDPDSIESRIDELREVTDGFGVGESALEDFEQWFSQQLGNQDPDDDGMRVPVDVDDSHRHIDDMFASLRE